MPDTISRRTFLNAAGGAAAISSSLPGQRIIGANDRVNMAIIGVGGHGFGNHLYWLRRRSEKDNIALVAVADVYRRRVDRALGVAKGAKGYMDYRELLANPDVDAVVIATPDHWHAKISIDAVNAGKNVYCEKPMTLTVEQAFAVREAVKRTGKVFTVGPQMTGNAAYWKANSVITDGRIGKVLFAQAGGGGSQRESIYNGWFKIDPTASPAATGADYVNWDMWLGWEFGLAPKIAWNPEHYFRFRKYWPYSGGQASDLLYHTLAPLLLAIAGPNGAFPRRATAAGGLYTFKDGRDVPDTYITTLDYPEEFTILLVNHSNTGARIPTLISGRHGSIEIGPARTPAGWPHEPTSDVRLKAEQDFAREFKEKNDNYSEVEIMLEPHRDIMGSFLDAIRGKGTVTCNIDLGVSTMVGIRLGVEAFRQNKTLLFDPAKQAVVG